jgi:serine/threonine protein kinase
VQDVARSARRPQTLVSSLGGFSDLAGKTIRSLQDLLITIQPLNLDLYKPENLPEQCKLGEGASYNVWKCLNRRSPTKDLVAVKKVKLPRGNSDFEAFQSRVACVLKDIEVMNHPPMADCENILNILGYGWNVGEGSIPFLVTELAPGGTLRQYLKANLSLRGLQKIKFCRDVMSGMSELHLCGVIHGDLKLDNVLVVAGMQARISDFGHSILRSSSPDGLEEAAYRGTEM